MLQGHQLKDEPSRKSYIGIPEETNRISHPDSAGSLGLADGGSELIVTGLI